MDIRQKWAKSHYFGPEAKFAKWCTKVVKVDFSGFGGGGGCEVQKWDHFTANQVKIRKFSFKLARYSSHFKYFG